MRIGELAALTKVSTRALRHYEKKGLLHPLRLDNGYREYGPDARFRVEKIRWLLAAGLSTKRILDVLPCLLVEKSKKISCRSLRQKLEKEVTRMEFQIDALDRSKRLLADVLAKK